MLVQDRTEMSKRTRNSGGRGRGGRRHSLGKRFSLSMLESKLSKLEGKLSKLEGKIRWKRRKGKKRGQRRKGGQGGKG